MEVSNKRINDSTIPPVKAEILEDFDHAKGTRGVQSQQKINRKLDMQINDVGSLNLSRKQSMELSTLKVQKFNIDEISFDDSELPISQHGGKLGGKTSGRKRKAKNDSSSLYSKKHLREANRKYIQEAKRKAVFPPTFVYSKLIQIVKEYMKEFFIDPKDLVQNSSGQINRKKGGKRALSQGAYESGDGPFDLKYDGTLGIRGIKHSKDKKRGYLNGVSKPNHFWWLISKAFLNYFLLDGAKDCLDSFLKGKEIKNKHNNDEEGDNEEKKEESSEKDAPVDISKFAHLFSTNCQNFESLMKDDTELQGLVKEDIINECQYRKNPLLDDNLWCPIKEEDSESDDEEGYERVK